MERVRERVSAPGHQVPKIEQGVFGVSEQILPTGENESICIKTLQGEGDKKSFIFPPTKQKSVLCLFLWVLFLFCFGETGSHCNVAPAVPELTM